MKKIILSFVLFFTFISSTTLAYSSSLPGGIQFDVQDNPIGDILNNIPGKKLPIVGVTCGQALEVPGDKVLEVNKCCTKPEPFDAEKSATNVLTDFMCLPEILTVPTRIVGGVLGALNPLNKIKGVGELIQGHWSDAIGDITGIKSLVGAGESATEKLCIGDIGSGLVNRVTQQKSFVEFQDNISKGGVTPCQEGAIPSTNKSSGVCKCVQQTTLSLAILCSSYIKDPAQSKACLSCAQRNGVYSGIGCIGTNASGLVASIMGIGIGLAGISALLCIIYSAFILQISQGNPERVKKAKEYLTNCIIGLLLILFSVFILRLIGVSILGIPGLS